MNKNCDGVLDYLDKKIRFWRQELKDRMDGPPLSAEKALAYVDAYQTMRYDLFGSALASEE